MKEKRKVPVRDTIKLLWAMDRKFPVIVILQGGLNALLFYLPVILVARISSTIKILAISLIVHSPFSFFCNSCISTLQACATVS